MDFVALVAASSGQVDPLEFSWPPAPGPDGQRTCLAYVLMTKQDGFLLCLPAAFFSQAELAPADSPDGPLRPGPHLQVQAPPVSYTEEGDWLPVPQGEPLSATVVDFQASASQLLAPLDLDVFLGQAFSDEDPSLYPLAAEVLAQARQWVLAEGASSAYQSAVSDGPKAAAADAHRPPRPKRPTVAQIAKQQATMAEAVAQLSAQLAQLQMQRDGFRHDPEAEQAARGEPAPAASGLSLRQAPLSSILQAPLEPRSSANAPQSQPPGKLPPFQSVPKSLAQVLGPPPPTRSLLDQAPRCSAQEAQEDQDGLLAAGISSGELPSGRPPDELAAAMMAQSRAMLALVAQISQGGDPLLDQTASSTSTRGAQTRQKLQAELAQMSGAFAERVRERARRRMAPAGVGSTEPFSLCRYLERYGGYARQRDNALVAWQVAIALDLVLSGQTNGAADVLSLLAVYLDQLTLDGGSTTVAWLLTLQQDPPQTLFTEPMVVPGMGPQPFTPLAEQRWVTSALGYLREMDTIAARRLEAKPKPKKPPGLPSSAAAETADLSKKQLRAAQWAAKKAAASAGQVPK